MLGAYSIVTPSNSGWTSAHTLLLGAAAVVLIAAFIATEARLPDPVMTLRIFAIRGLAASSAVRGLLITGMYATFFLGLLYLEHVRGFGVLQTGLAFLPQTFVLAVRSVGPTAWLVGRFGPRVPLLNRARSRGRGFAGAPGRERPHPLLPRGARPVRADGNRRRARVHAAADDRYGPSPVQGRRPRVGDRQRLAPDVGGVGTGGARNRGRRPHANARRARSKPRGRTARRLPPGVPHRGRRCRRRGRRLARLVARTHPSGRGRATERLPNRPSRRSKPKPPDRGQEPVSAIASSLVTVVQLREVAVTPKASPASAAHSFERAIPAGCHA